MGSFVSSKASIDGSDGYRFGGGRGRICQREGRSVVGSVSWRSSAAAVMGSEERRRDGEGPVCSNGEESGSGAAKRRGRICGGGENPLVPVKAEWVGA